MRETGYVLKLQNVNKITVIHWAGTWYNWRKNSNFSKMMSFVVISALCDDDVCGIWYHKIGQKDASHTISRKDRKDTFLVIVKKQDKEIEIDLLQYSESGKYGDPRTHDIIVGLFVIDQHIQVDWVGGLSS